MYTYMLSLYRYMYTYIQKYVYLVHTYMCIYGFVIKKQFFRYNCILSAFTTVVVFSKAVCKFGNY